MTQEFSIIKLENIHWDRDEALYELDLWGLKPIAQIIGLIDSMIDEVETPDLEVLTNLHVLVNRLAQLVEDVGVTFNRLSNEHLESERARKEASPDSATKELNLDVDVIKTLLEVCAKKFDEIEPRLTVLEKEKAPDATGSPQNSGEGERGQA